MKKRKNHSSGCMAKVALEDKEAIKVRLELGHSSKNIGKDMKISRGTVYKVKATTAARTT